MGTACDSLGQTKVLQDKPVYTDQITTSKQLFACAHLNLTYMNRTKICYYKDFQQPSQSVKPKYNYTLAPVTNGVLQEKLFAALTVY
jgi:hypothetical protein